ncbi:alkaline phosphatase D family protein [Streptomyces cirratus]
MTSHLSSSASVNPRRRTVVKAAAATAALAPIAALGATAAHAADSVPAFLHGVASGDPAARRDPAVDPHHPDRRRRARLRPRPGHPVGWEVAEDKSFSRVVASGSVTATAAADHTVKADVRGLRPKTVYWYRFTAGATVSPAGRTLTAPAADASTAGVRFGVVSCANWEAGYFSAYRHLAARTDLDAVLHLGDYIYEYQTGGFPEAKYVVRQHEPQHEIVNLADYRTRHGKYKTDADLQAVHAAHPVIAIWDDHEFANDCWSGGAENHTPGAEGDWAARAAAAKQAYFEWMPVRPSIAGTVYRRLRFGTLADLHLLDLRTFRSQQSKIGSGAADDPERTITGRAQLDWLKSGLSSSHATWQLVGTSVMISPVAFGSLPAHLLQRSPSCSGCPRGA